MTSIDSNEVTDVEVQSQNDNLTSEVIPTNNDQNPNTSTIAEFDDETLFNPEIFTINEAYFLQKNNCIVNTLNIGDLGTLEIQSVIRNNIYGVTLLPNKAEDLFDKLMAVVTSIEKPQNSEYRPSVRNLIYGQKMNEDWVRGYIVSQLPYLKMAVIDEAIIATINNITTCDNISSEICEFGALCEVTDVEHKFEEGDVHEFSVTGNRRNGVHEILIRTKDYVKATVRRWIPMPEQMGVPCAEVDNETEVIVTGYRNHIHLYVRPLDTVGLEHYNHVMQNVAKCAQTAPFLRKPPAIGDMVIAEAADKNYYRAFVTRVEDDNITILYLDLGRKEVTNKKKLKTLPDNLKEVILRDVPRNIPLIKEIDEYLAHLVATEVRLLCTYDGIPSIEGVYLKLPDGETVNNMICRFLKRKRGAE